ncbi:hypothetical protein JM654_08430 [Microbacterium oxydans]|nr:hypothetical protein [Microbacterium oxydans]
MPEEEQRRPRRNDDNGPRGNRASGGRPNYSSRDGGAPVVRAATTAMAVLPVVTLALLVVRAATTAMVVRLVVTVARLRP